MKLWFSAQFGKLTLNTQSQRPMDQPNLEGSCMFLSVRMLLFMQAGVAFSMFQLLDWKCLQIGMLLE